jgi:hypothetical protein
MQLLNAKQQAKYTILRLSVKLHQRAQRRNRSSNIRIRGVAYLRVHLSSPLPPPLRLGLALRPRPASRLEGSQPPPPPWLFGG